MNIFAFLSVIVFSMTSALTEDEFNAVMGNLAATGKNRVKDFFTDRNEIFSTCTWAISPN